MKEGYRSGMLTTVTKIQCSRKKPHQSAKWLCRCDCGNDKITLETSLYNKIVKSCGCHDFKNKKLHDKENYDDLIKEKIIKNICVDENGCWIWQGSKHRQGYGNLSYKRIPSLAHRVSWMVHRGEIPKDMKVCHSCDVTSCVNPEHLFIGTQKNNVEDAISKGKFEKRNMGKRRNKLVYEQVLEIKKLSSEGISRKDIEKKFGVGQTCIAKILQGVSWNKNWIEEL